MKTIFKRLFLVLLTTLCFNLSAQIVYVNHAATGANDGSTWADAYNDLNDALADAPVGDNLWVAKGTYTPATINGSSASTFTITQDMVILGGFDGVSTDINDRDPEQYVTILSGDLNGDDLKGDLGANREDNVMTVVTIGPEITNATQLDGLTISNGHADGTQSNASTQGAGMYITGSPMIKNCELSNHFSIGNGGAIYVFGQGAGGLTFEGCRFENNKASSNNNSVGGAISINSVPGNGVIFQDCLFENNEGDWGGGINAFYSSLFIEETDFLNNFTHRHGGAIRALFTSNNSFEMHDSHLEGNSAAFGGALYFNTNFDNVELIVENTTFTNNHAIVPPFGNWGSGGGGVSGYIGPNANNTLVNFENGTVENNITEGTGGGIRITSEGSNTNINILKCDFSENESVFHGGGLRIFTSELANETTMLVDSCTFLKNDNSTWTGGGFRALLVGSGNNLTLSNSWFSENYSTLAGAGAGIYGFDPTANGSVQVVHNTFESNSGNWDAGLSIGSGTDAGFFEYTISNCDFLDNEAEIDAGALDLYAEVPATFDVRDCLFEGNSAQGVGGGLYVAISHPEVDIKVSNCILTQNSSSFGAAIGGLPFVEDPDDFTTTTEANILFENCLIHNNSGEGGTIGLIQTGNVQFQNSTIAENQAGGIVLDSSSVATLQNTILYNPGFLEYEAIASDAIITSNGGNLFSDLSLTAFAANTDQQDVDPLFVALDDFHLQDASPAIDKGFDSGNLPDYDLDGNARINGCVDIGAYESDHTTGVECLVVANQEIADNEQLSLSPNPALDLINITLPVTYRNHFEITIYDSQGKWISAFAVSNDQSIYIGDLNSGMYTLKVVQGQQVFTGRLVKI